MACLAVAALLWFAASRMKPFWQVADFVAPCHGLGRRALAISSMVSCGGDLPTQPALGHGVSRGW